MTDLFITSLLTSPLPTIHQKPNSQPKDDQQTCYFHVGRKHPLSLHCLRMRICGKSQTKNRKSNANLVHIDAQIGEDLSIKLHEFLSTQ
jgi:hypothetical protein